MGLTDITALTSRIQELERENSRLRAILDKNGISYTFKDNNLQENVAPAPVVTYSLEEKVAIFQGLFQGRSDVFAKRWYSETSKKSGYQPVCEREWNREFARHGKYLVTSSVHALEMVPMCGYFSKRLSQHLKRENWAIPFLPRR